MSSNHSTENTTEHRPENYLFLLSKKIFSGSKYPKNVLFYFEKKSTAENTTEHRRLHLFCPELAERQRVELHAVTV